MKSTLLSTLLACALFSTSQAQAQQFVNLTPVPMQMHVDKGVYRLPAQFTIGGAIASRQKPKSLSLILINQPLVLRLPIARRLKVRHSSWCTIRPSTKLSDKRATNFR